MRRRRGAPVRSAEGGDICRALLPDVLLQEVVEVSEPSRCTYQAQPASPFLKVAMSFKQPVCRAPAPARPLRGPGAACGRLLGGGGGLRSRPPTPQGAGGARSSRSATKKTKPPLPGRTLRDSRPPVVAQRSRSKKHRLRGRGGGHT